ncbi:MAG: terminase family protein [Eubacteriales bacterium]|nr:terminase family protein [Eubacteriales bacterium]
MENDVINLQSLSADAPLLKYNDWPHLTVKPRVRPTVEAKALRPDAPPRLHKKQLQFHQSLAKSRFVFGGNRTGKSVCGAIETIWYATGLHPFVKIDHAMDGWVVSLTRQVQRDVAQAKILQYLPPEWIVKTVMVSGSSFAPAHGVIDFILVRNVFGTVSKIGFRNCEQGRERFQGVSLDYVWFDEEPPADIYDECLLRLLDRGGVHWVTMTPLKGRSWVYDRIYLRQEQQPDLACFWMSWDDNPYLSPAEKQFLIANLPPDVLESRQHGHFVASEGLVFPNFTADNILEPVMLPQPDAYYIGIDPGYRNPTAVVWAVSVGENLYVISDYEVAGLTVADHCRAILERTKNLGWNLKQVKILIDSAANQKTSACEVSTATQYRQHGVAVDTNVNKNLAQGLLAMKARFSSADGRRNLFVFKNCVHLLGELRGYYWGDGEQPQKVNDHTIDALRYIVMDWERSCHTPSAPLNTLGQAKKHLIKSLAGKRFG